VGRVTVAQPDEIVRAAILIRGELPRLLGDHAAQVDARLAELLTGAPEEITDELIELLRAYPETRRWLRAYLGRPDGEKSLPPDRGNLAAGSQPRRRYLKGQCPESIPVGKPFSLLASIVLAGSSNTELAPFDVPPEGRDVLLVVHAPGLRLLGDQRQTVHVPAEGDSRPVMFELRADVPGPRSVSVTAWVGGSYLGELLVEITAERDRRAGPHRDVLAEVTTEPTEGAVSLVVRYDPAQNAYRFEFRDEDNPDEVTSNLAYEPGPRVEQLVAGLDDLAKGRSGYSADQVRNYLVQSGAGLWGELIPPRLREQFWDRQHRIRHLTILADKDVVPWEVLYPMDRGHDAGFLVEQFPVTRAIFGRRPARRLSLWPARFVLAEGSLPEARDEIDAMRLSLDPGQPPGDVISALTPLQELIASGDFGLLHFACHGTYNPADGSSIKLGNVQFTPTLMNTAAINKVLARSAPTVFINACRSAGLNATYNRLDGWASKFLEAGAAAFIGTLWAVSDGAAREFAQELYSQLQAGSSLGEAVMRARQAAHQPDDPTWLAYTAYGNPRATLGQQRP
jgi:CHAT domain